jgi:peroxiredoxin
MIDQSLSTSKPKSKSDRGEFRLAKVKIGEVAPGFTLRGVDGKTQGLGDYKDKKAIAVVFSCNHCPTVKDYEDRMVQIQKDYMNRGVVLVAINPNDSAKYPEDSFDNMVVRAREKHFNFPYLRDEDQSVARAYGAERTPEVFLIDSRGVLRYHGRIDDSTDPRNIKSPDLRNALDSLLAGRPISVVETEPHGCTVKWR